MFNPILMLDKDVKIRFRPNLIKSYGNSCLYVILTRPTKQQTHCEMDQKWTDHEPKMDEKWAKNEPKIDRKWNENEPKMNGKWTEYEPNMEQK